VTSTQTVSLAQARRIALAAQGFAKARPDQASRRHFHTVIDRLGLLQIDSVNVLARAHYLPAFSRIGAYEQDHLHDAAWTGSKRTLFEYWGHEASLLPVRLYPHLRWRMERGEGVWGGIARFARERPDFVAAVLAEIADRGALAASELGQGGRSTGAWWGWSEGKQAVEYLLWSGQLAVATRRGNFERVYDLPERTLPKAALSAPSVEEADAKRELLRVAARALGIATASDLRDYFRLSPGDAVSGIAELVEAGELVPVQVAGWTKPAYLHAEASCPRRISAAALLSPFDPVVWERARTERLFDFRYRIEIYTPKHKREHGYYVLPFLLGDRLVARVDLKADRARRTLKICAAHAEPGKATAEVAEALSAELATLAKWLDLNGIEIEPAGDLAPLLARR
jgi:uncharacterized protein YcaQ